MTESMKFGPEWLRNLSETPVQTQPQVRYQLAEYRYGREEMLALFSSNLIPPDDLKTLTGLYVEKPQIPLALNTMSDDETRLWNRGINSDAVLRAAGKGGEGRGGLRGAGGGRGRGRGGPASGPTPYFGRGGGGGSGDPPTRQPFPDEEFGRPRTAFDHRGPTSGPPTRDNWSERNGGEGRGRSSESNWRRGGRAGGGSAGLGEEEEWRPPLKWPGGGGARNWRDEDSWDPMPHPKSNHHHLPEWATEKSSEGGGTFDSSGAFRTSEGDEEEPRPQRRPLERKPPPKPDEELEPVKPDAPPPPVMPQTEEKEPPEPVPSPKVQSSPPPQPPQPSPPLQPPHKPPSPVPVPIKHSEPIEDPLSHMTDDIAADLVAKLMEDEENQQQMWYYRDPQGQVQGPFTNVEMAEWFDSGYFTFNLLVRRACDPNYATLGDLIKVWGCIPFLPEQQPKESPISQDLLQQQQQAQYRSFLLRQPGGPARQGIPPVDWMETQPHPPLIDPVLPPQYAPPQTAQMAHQTNNTNLRALLLQMQQQQTLQQQRLNQPPPSLPKPPLQPTGPPPRTTEEISRKVSDFLRGLQAKSEAKQMAAAQMQQTPPPVQSPPQVMEMLMSLHQQNQQQQTAAPSSLQTLLRQMQATQQNKIHHPNNSPGESVWNGSNWNQWSPHPNPKGIKTEQQVLEEQLRAEDKRKRDEHMKGLKEEMSVPDAFLRSIEEEEMRRKEKQDGYPKEAQDMMEMEEELRRKQEASRRAEVERQRKGEEKRKKDEEKRKKDEEKKERERLKEEEKKKKEAEEAAERKRAADVMAKVQRSQWLPPQPSNTSILEIQRSEREHQQMIRGIQAQQQQQQQQHEEQAKFNSTTGLQLKWTEKAPAKTAPVESLADIQAEQREYLFKVKQQQWEKEKAERGKEKEKPMGSWSQGLTWSSWAPAGGNPTQPTAPSNSQFNDHSTLEGFWGDYPASAPAPVAVAAPKPQPAPPAQPVAQKESKNKAKRDEMDVMKLFAAPANDEFTQWCISALSNIQCQSSVDIPTFAGFLRDIESVAEIQEYIRVYLGESKEALDFSRQFIERKRAADSATSIGSANSTGGPGANTNNSLTNNSGSDFQQVKGKSKKGKKGRMQRVDSRILNFSTTPASDRINVGDRQYPEE